MVRLRRGSRKIKILGCGSSVQLFLERCASKQQEIAVEVYSRHKPKKRIPKVMYHDLGEFVPSDDFIFYCCSIDEASYLKKHSLPKIRLSVARPNFSITDHFIDNGYFDKGIVFVLTNPSEIIAERIFRKTGRKEIYALGLSIDARRLNSILSEDGLNRESFLNFPIAGNELIIHGIRFGHWHFSQA